MKNSFKHTGFTLLELMVTLAVMAILVGIAAPSMRSFLLKNGVQSDQRELLADFSVARGKAIETNSYVSICGKAAGSNACNSSNDWSNGWIVFVDNGAGTATSANGILEGDEEVVRIKNYDGPNTVVVQDDSSGAAVNVLGFDQRGYMNTRIHSERTEIFVCDPESEALHARAVFVEVTGRAVGSRDIDSDNVHEDLGGDDLSC